MGENIRQQARLSLLATADGSYTLYDSVLDETYHSKFGAATESHLVYLHNAGVYQRLQSQLPTSVLEIGFGTGYNFVCTAHQADMAQCKLHYTGIEMLPPSTTLARTVLKENAPDQSPLAEFALQAISNIRHRGTSSRSEYNPLISLTVNNADATAWQFPESEFDAIYLDAFSSKNNPLLWQTAFLAPLCRSLRPGGKLATYCVNRSFREALTHAGWLWEKLPGPMGKREVLIAKPATDDSTITEN